MAIYLTWPYQAIRTRCFEAKAWRTDAGTESGQSRLKQNVTSAPWEYYGGKHASHIKPNWETRHTSRLPLSNHIPRRNEFRQKRHVGKKRQKSNKTKIYIRQIYIRQTKKRYASPSAKESVSHWFTSSPKSQHEMKHRATTHFVLGSSFFIIHL